MTEAEAEWYTTGSYYFGQRFYHGTDKLDAEKILTGGVEIDRNESANYGKGFYLSKDRLIAQEVARYRSRPAILEVRLKMNNPKVFATNQEALLFMDDNGIDPYGDNGGSLLTTLLQNQGFDGVEIVDLRYVVAFYPEQVVPYRIGGLNE